VRGFWKCQRQSGGVKCGASNPNRVRKCQRCGKPRPARKRPAHMSALSLPYEHYEALNGGPNCGICGEPPKPGKRHHRDHEHKGVGTPRGLLCWRDNKLLHLFVTIEWLEAALAYLRRVEARRP
jgi:hypothetical protein